MKVSLNKLLKTTISIWKRDTVLDRHSDEYILVVDDDPDAREILSYAVEYVGLGAMSVEDGLEAIDVLLKEGKVLPVLVLLDLMMPGLDGFTVLSRMRAHPTTRHIPVIVVTAARPGQVDMLRLPGVKDVVRKGHFTIQSLGQLITETVSLT
jgi:CheY-like chemotaxis protein